MNKHLWMHKQSASWRQPLAMHFH